jgi:riboflavin biosynthesis pyrimidine reductase
MPLRGLYLADEVPPREGTRPFVYTNFITSLDGRIAQPDPQTRLRRVPPAIANERDWRLYLELAAQADVLLTTARHLRAVAAARHADLLALDADLADWRTGCGMPPEPKVAVLSERLELPLESLLPGYAHRLLVVTSRSADRGRVAAAEAAGVPVLEAGAGPGLGGRAVIEALGSVGLPRVYSIAGPRVHHTLLEAKVLDRLYLTVALQVIGGEEVDTLSRGASLEPPAAFGLRSLYRDPAGGQLFACFERTGEGPSVANG